MLSLGFYRTTIRDSTLISSPTYKVWIHAIILIIHRIPVSILSYLNVQRPRDNSHCDGRYDIPSTLSLPA
ncbi:hypothetical protein BDW67DRAFT_151171 [Aspergillus spinulosporus]